MAELTCSYIPRMGQLVIFEDGEDTASCMVFHYGDRWQMFNIRGRSFTKAWPQMWAVCMERGCKELSGYVTPAHARILKMAADRLNVAVEIFPPQKTGDMEAEYCWMIARPMTPP